MTKESIATIKGESLTGVVKYKTVQKVIKSACLARKLLLCRGALNLNLKLVGVLLICLRCFLLIGDLSHPISLANTAWFG